MKKIGVLIVSLALCVVLLLATPLPSARAEDIVSVSGIYLSDTALALEPTGTWLLYASAEPENATNRRLTWESSNRGVAVVDYAGKVVAVAPGTATITVSATDGSGKTAACRVTVRARPTATPTVKPTPSVNPTAKVTASPSPTVKPTASPSPTPEAAKGITAYPDVEKGGLNLRAEPNKNSKLVTVIPGSASFTVLSYGEEWSYVRYNGKTGYVMTSLFRLSGQSTPKPTATPRLPKGNMARVVTEKGDLNMRTEPQRHAKRVCLIPRGAEIEILAHGTEWCHARYDSHTGYVQTKYLVLGSKVQKSSAPIPNSAEGGKAASSPKAKASPTPVPQNKTFSKARKAQVATEQGGLNLRESPSSRANRLLIIPEGATVQVHSIEGRWCRVTYNGTTGYVMTKYLKIN